jgi:hypothetical protein
MLEIKSEDLVLVAIVKTPRDLDIARVLGWYRIPLATSPKTIRVDWLAFYQTSAFGDEKWSVRYIARVKGHKSWRRFTFLFTTGNRILSAVELKDLTVPASDEHDVLWKLLKERGLEFANAVEESNA